MKHLEGRKHDLILTIKQGTLSWYLPSLLLAETKLERILSSFSLSFLITVRNVPEYLKTLL